MTQLVWLSDLHLDIERAVCALDSEAALARAIAHVSAHHADAHACLISGDLCDRGDLASYRALARALAALPMPVWPLVGNHDERAALRAALTLPAGVDPNWLQYRVDLDGPSLLVLDTLDAGKAGGVLCAERWAWLEAQLRALDGRPLVVALHHPPVAVGVAPFDAIGLAEGERLIARLAAHRGAVLVLAGHVHRAFSGVCAGVPWASARSTLLQAPPPRPAWDWDSFAPADEPPGYALLQLDGDDHRIDWLQLPH